MPHPRTPFITIRTEGALLPADLLQRLLDGDRDLDGLTPESYHLSGEKLNEAINRSWNRLLGAWVAFNSAREKDTTEHGTSVTRERWLLPLFQELGYGRLIAARPIEIEGKAYPISHGWGEATASVPIHLVGFKVKLDSRTPGAAGAAKASPHSQVQELLNRDENRLWGLLSNGLRLRVLRDNKSMTRQAFLEFDLEAMMTGEVYADFAVLWMVCHQSRVEPLGEGSSARPCWLEQWSKAAQERGTRALDSLRDGVEAAITALGSGFLAHPANGALKAKLRSGELTRESYYRQLLRLVYRLIFLFAAEDRDLLLTPTASLTPRTRYKKYYSAARLRRLAERARGGRHPDLYASLRLVMEMLGGREKTGNGETGLGLPVLGSFLFSHEALPDLESAQLENSSLLSAIRNLAFTVEGKTRRSVDYKNMGARELGSVYESLLELHPVLNADAATFELATASGNERKTTGSYYTAEELITVLLDSALDPVVAQAILRAGSSVEKQIAALLNLKICDPACGSGHFLIATARRIARRLAQLRSGDEEPSPEVMRAALRDVIAHCIYGVDSNPMAVELCKVNLWLEALEPGKPLSFLDAHIQCVDSLVGVSAGLDISEIPDEAFNPAFGDDKATAAALKKRNKRERTTGQLGLFGAVRDEKGTYDISRWLTERAAQVEAMPEDNPAQVRAKAAVFAELQGAATFYQKQLEYNLWTAAFFWHIPKGDAETMLAPTQQALVAVREGKELKPELRKKVDGLAKRLNFLHWELAFPKVFSGDQPGFDCVLGNPPWERIKLQEGEFFGMRDPKIANAATKATRQKLIDSLNHSNPALALAFEDAKHAADATSNFVRESQRYPFSSVGDVNTYALFTEHARSIISSKGKVGIIIPTGIATDDMQKDFFRDLMEKNSLVEFIGFENEEFIFQGIANVVKFCTLVLSGYETSSHNPKFAFYLRRFEQLHEKERFFEVSAHDLALLNPNTLTCPVFRTKKDSELTKRIYKALPIIYNEGTGSNPWGVTFTRMYDMAKDSHLFYTNKFTDAVQLYEAKMFWHFDHRFSSYEFKGVMSGKGGRGLPDLPLEMHQNPKYTIIPQHWISKDDAESRIPDYWQKQWLIAFRGITSAKLERTTVFSVVPRCGLVDTAPVLFINNSYIDLTACFLANVNSLVFDYISRQKVAGTHLNYFFLKQFPALPPSAYTSADIAYIAPRVLELVYTAYDLKPFAEDMGYHGEPFRWDEGRRAHLRAQLDAYYARLYGLSRDELRYILDPQDVHGPDFPGETFRVLKEKEIKLYGEYRTRRLVLEAWDKLPSTAAPEKQNA